MCVCVCVYVGNKNFTISATIYEIFTIAMCMTLTDLKNMPRANVNMPIESPHMTFYMMAIVIFALSVAVYGIFAIKRRVALTLNFKM